MPLLKIKPADPMKSDSGNDSIDTIVKETMGKEPYISFSRANENPVQWIQLLNALEQQELPGWSLLAPVNIQMQKCEKCSREFCWTISYRRHMRLHRRKLNLDKRQIGLSSCSCWFFMLVNRIGSAKAQGYKEAGHDTIIIARAEYGSGRSHDWAVNGPMLQEM